MADPHVRYLAYGSNLSRHRLRAYIDGADASSPWGAHEPCVDRSPTPAVAAYWIHGRLLFVDGSRRWGGGVGVVDLAVGDERFFAVEYTMSRMQFAHLVRYESVANVVPIDWAALADRGRYSVGEGSHGLIRRPAGHEGYVITGPPPATSTEPARAYVTTMRTGLVEWIPAGEADAYLGRVTLASAIKGVSARSERADRPS